MSDFLTNLKKTFKQLKNSLIEEKNEVRLSNQEIYILFKKLNEFVNEKKNVDKKEIILEKNNTKETIENKEENFNKKEKEIISFEDFNINEFLINSLLYLNKYLESKKLVEWEDKIAFNNTFIELLENGSIYEFIGQVKDLNYINNFYFNIFVKVVITKDYENLNNFVEKIKNKKYKWNMQKYIKETGKKYSLRNDFMLLLFEEIENVGIYDENSNSLEECFFIGLENALVKNKDEFSLPLLNLFIEFYHLNVGYSIIIEECYFIPENIKEYIVEDFEIEKYGALSEVIEYINTNITKSKEKIVD